MIYTISKVTIKQYEATVDRKIILYRGDKNVELQFEIVESKFRQFRMVGENVIDNLEASYGQLIIQRQGVPPIISNITETKDGRIVFVLNGDMIDEKVELGAYDFQLRLYNHDQSSRVTLPPIYGGIEIVEPITHEDENE